MKIAAIEALACEHDLDCITCSDQAVTARVIELLPDAMARVETGNARETISVILIEAALGDLVLVHAGEAIAKVER